MSIEKQTFHKIFVGNVPYECTNKEFRDIFKDKRGYVTADIKRKRNSIISRGFGFVVLQSNDDVDALLKQTIMLKNRKLRMFPYKKNITKISEPEEFVIYIDKIPPFTSNDVLIDKLSEIGVISKFTLKYRERGSYGEVVFRDQIGYNRALISTIYIGNTRIKLMSYRG